MPDAKNNAVDETFKAPSQSSIKEKFLRFLFGADIFISYSRADGITYAAGLANELVKLKFSCKLDQWGSQSGKQIPKQLKQALRRSAMLVLVGTKGASESDPVTQEIIEFKRTNRMIVPIIFEQVMLKEQITFKDGVRIRVAESEEIEGDLLPPMKEALWAEQIEGLPLSPEDMKTLKTGTPSPDIVNRIEKTFKFSRKDERLRKTSVAVAVLVLLLIGASVVASVIATVKAAEAVRKTAEAAEQQQRADAARAEAETQTRAAKDATAEAEKQRRIATDEKAEADKQRELAERNGLEAKKQAGIATANEKEAQRQQGIAEAKRQEAQAQSQIASSRRLASSALAHLDDSLDYALLTSLEANTAADTFEARSSLLTALYHSPQLIAFLGQHKSRVNRMAFSPGGETLVSGSDDGALMLWDSASQELRRPPIYLAPGQATDAMAFSSDGKRFAVSFSPHGPISEQTRGTIFVLDAITWERVSTIDFPRPITSLALSPDGQMLSYGALGGIVVLRGAEEPSKQFKVLYWHKGALGYAGMPHLVFSPDGEKLAGLISPLVGFNEKSIRPDAKDNLVLLWSVSEKQQIGEPLSTPETTLHSIAFSPDSRTLAVGTGNGDVILRDITTQPFKDSWLRHQDGGSSTSATPIISLGFNREGSILASITQGRTLSLWDMTTKKQTGRELKGLSDSFGIAAFSMDAGRLASGTENGSVMLWDALASPALKLPVPQRLSRVQDVAFDPKSSVLAVAANGSLWLWDSLTGQKLAAPPRPKITLDEISVEVQISNVAFSKDGRRLVTSGSDGRVVLWDWDGKNARQVDTFSIGTFSAQRDMVFDADLKSLVTNQYLGDVILWDVNKRGRQADQLPIHSQAFDTYEGHIAITPDGKTLAVIGDREGELSLWNIAVPQKPEQLKVPPTIDLSSLSFDDEGKLLATGSVYGVVTIWSAKTLEKIATLRAPGGVYSVAFSSDSKMLATGDDKGVITLWDIDARQSLGQFRAAQAAKIRVLAFGANNRILASGGESGVELWDVSLESWKKRAQQIARKE